MKPTVCDANSPELDAWVHTKALDSLPLSIAVIDRDYRIVRASQKFADTFGDWCGRSCHDVYKKSATVCKSCPARQTFLDGKSRVKEETGIDRDGNPAYYVLRTAAMVAEDGSIPYVIEISNNVTEHHDLQRAYRVLFDRVPCAVQILDRDLRVVLANERQLRTFGPSEGKHCHEVYKRRNSRCHPCPALKAFQDGGVHSSEQSGIDKNGQQTLYAVTAAPLSSEGEQVEQVIEISMDITKVRSLEKQLRKAHAFEDSLISNSTDGIIAFDREKQVIVFNPAAEALLKYPVGEAVSGGIHEAIFPAEFQDVLNGRREACHLDDTVIVAKDGEVIPVRFNGVTLSFDDRSLGWAAFFSDLRPIKILEAQNLESERLAAVGETVAGLAHSVKNVLQALEGGLYALGSGLKRDDRQRVAQGWAVIERNFEKVTRLIRDFLSFSKGRIPETKQIDPNAPFKEVITLHQAVAIQEGIRLVPKLDNNLRPAFLDADGLHTCLTNLLSNAIDACRMSDKSESNIVLRTYEREGVLVYEVEDDGCGMDCEVKSRVFTTFFTTKGGGGTGLGLLTTRKIVQEHGGSITMTTEPGEGTIFRIELPRERLPHRP